MEIHTDTTNAPAGEDIAFLSQVNSTWDIFEWKFPELPSIPSSAVNTSSDSPAAPSATPSTPDFQVTTQLPSIPLTSEMVYLLNQYRRGVATWMDVFDRHETYQRDLSQRAMTSELLLRSICAFTARQLSLIAAGEVWAPAAVRYYTQSLNLLIREVSSLTTSEDVLSATVILSSYEVLAAQGHEHRRHYEGALRLITLQGINAQSSGTDRANFWIWVRHEISVAIVSEAPLQMNPRHWKIRWHTEDLDEDILGGQILWLVARAVNWVFGEGTSHEYHELLKDAERWYKSLPDAFRGAKYGDVVEEGLFRIHFPIPAAALAMMWFHTLHILLYAERTGGSSSNKLQVQEYAAEIISISISDIPPAVRCFSILPLYFAGKHIDNVVWKSRVWILLENIQRDIGYHTKSIVALLQRISSRADLQSL